MDRIRKDLLIPANKLGKKKNNTVYFGDLQGQKQGRNEPQSSQFLCLWQNCPTAPQVNHTISIMIALTCRLSLDQSVTGFDLKRCHNRRKQIRQSGLCKHLQTVVYCVCLVPLLLRPTQNLETGAFHPFIWINLRHLTQAGVTDTSVCRWLTGTVALTSIRTWWTGLDVRFTDEAQTGSSSELRAASTPMSGALSNQKRASQTLKISIIEEFLHLLRLGSVTWLIKTQTRDESKHEPRRTFCPTNPDRGLMLDTSSATSSFQSQLIWPT